MEALITAPEDAVVVRVEVSGTAAMEGGDLLVVLS